MQELVNKYFKGVILTNKQKVWLQTILENKSNELFICDNKKSGKTFIILIGIILLCIKYEVINILILKNSLFCSYKYFIEKILSKSKKIKFKINMMNYFIKIKKSNIYFLNIENINNIICQNYNIIYLNREIELKKEEIDILRIRLIDSNSFIIYEKNKRDQVMKNKGRNT